MTRRSSHCAGSSTQADAGAQAAVREEDGQGDHHHEVLELPAQLLGDGGVVGRHDAQEERAEEGVDADPLGDQGRGEDGQEERR